MRAVTETVLGSYCYFLRTLLRKIRYSSCRNYTLLVHELVSPAGNCTRPRLRVRGTRELRPGAKWLTVSSMGTQRKLLRCCPLDSAAGHRRPSCRIKKAKRDLDEYRFTGIFSGSRARRSARETTRENYTRWLRNTTRLEKVAANRNELTRLPGVSNRTSTYVDSERFEYLFECTDIYCVFFL